MTDKERELERELSVGNDFVYFLDVLAVSGA